MKPIFVSVKAFGITVNRIQSMKALQLKQKLFLNSQLSFLVRLLIIGFVLFPGITPAQDTVTGAFEGRVTDKSNADVEISGAQVRITNVETGKFYEAVTDSQGRFFQGLLAPGTYKITVTKS